LTDNIAGVIMQKVDFKMWPGDKAHEACGIFGIYAPGEDIARLTYFAVGREWYALALRGEEGERRLQVEPG
jgi:amidophosphoribosyltransferase